MICLRIEGVTSVAGLGVVDHEVLVVLHHEGQVLEGHVAARSGLVEAPVRVFLDRDRFRGSRHGELVRAYPLGSIACFFGTGHRFVKPGPLERVPERAYVGWSIPAGQIADRSN